jgi:hypothetical protein
MTPRLSLFWLWLPQREPQLDSSHRWFLLACVSATSDE